MFVDWLTDTLGDCDPVTVLLTLSVKNWVGPGQESLAELIASHTLTFNSVQNRLSVACYSWIPPKFPQAVPTSEAERWTGEQSGPGTLDALTSLSLAVQEG